VQDDRLATMNLRSLHRAARVIPALFVGAMATALAAQWSVPVPGSPVPQSLQTLAVVVVGGVLGAGRGGLAMLLYIAMGAAGLPVFADGGSGVARLWGPTGGYLAGFVVAAGVAGWWVRRARARTCPGLVAGMVLAHLVVLGMGWVRLAWLLGPGDALAQGVAPFVWGGVVKSVVAAGILWAWVRWEGGEDPWSPVSEPVEPGTPGV